MYSRSLGLILLFLLFLPCNFYLVSHFQLCLMWSALCTPCLRLWSISTSSPSDLTQTPVHPAFIPLDPSQTPVRHTLSPLDSSQTLSILPSILCQSLVQPTYNRQVVNLPARLDLSSWPFSTLGLHSEYIHDTLYLASIV